jgi:hypothetical protein
MKNPLQILKKLYVKNCGVEVNKKDLPEKLIKKFEKDLTVKPKKFNPRGGEIQSFPIYQESDDKSKLMIPPHYIREHHPTLKVDYSKIRKGKPIKIKFKGNIKDNQTKAVTYTRKGITRLGGGVLSLPPGRGKTVLAINEICYRSVKTLVVVHKDFLLRQWRNRFKQFSTASVGIIKGKKVDVENRDVVIATVQSLAKSKYDEHIFDDFGMVVIDECHHMGAPVYCRALRRIFTKYMLGLSGTSKRDDGLSKVFHWWMGPILYHEDPLKNPRVKVHRYQYTTTNPNFKQHTAWARGNRRMPDHVKTLSALVEVKERNDFIVERVMNRLQNPRAKILILSARREHLRKLKRQLKKQWDEEQHGLSLAIKKFESEGRKDIADELKKCSRKLVTAYYVGGMKEDELDEAEKADVIFGTYSMAEEGLDIQSLNTVVLGTTKPKIFQSVGRILRVMDYIAEIQPLVIDIADLLPMCVRQAALRSKEYASCNYTIEDFDELGNSTNVLKETPTHKMAFKPSDIMLCDSD